MALPNLSGSLTHTPIMQPTTDTFPLCILPLTSAGLTGTGGGGGGAGATLRTGCGMVGITALRGGGPVGSSGIAAVGGLRLETGPAAAVPPSPKVEACWRRVAGGGFSNTICAGVMQRGSVGGVGIWTEDVAGPWTCTWPGALQQ